MARLKNTVTGVTVNVADEKAERLGPEWEPVDEKPAPRPRSKKTTEQ